MKCAEKIDNDYIIIMFVIGLFVLSPVFYWINIKKTFVVVAVLIYIILKIIKNDLGVDKRLIIVFVVLLLLSSITSLWWGLSLNNVLEPLVVITSILLLYLSNMKTLERFVAYASWFLMCVLVMSWVGFILSINNVYSPKEFIDVDGSVIYYYLTTLASSGFLYIRPSGIFDEPGTLSFVICSLVIYRKYLKMDMLFSWVLLFLGLITFSVVHVLCVLIFMLLERKRFVYNVYLLLFVVVLYVIYSSMFKEAVDLELLRRFEYDQSTGFVGDNRSGRFINALKYVDLDNIIFGLDGRLFYDYHNNIGKYGDIGENFLSPLVIKGIFVSLPYYVVVLWLLIIAFRKNSNYGFVVMVLMLLQRPYVTVSGYSLLSILPIVMYYKDNNRGFVLLDSNIDK